MQETWVRSLGGEDPLKKEMAAHSSILAQRIPWTEDHSRLQSMGSQESRHDLATKPPPQRIQLKLELINVWPGRHRGVLIQIPCQRRITTQLQGVRSARGLTYTLSACFGYRDLSPCFWRTGASKYGDVNPRSFSAALSRPTSDVLGRLLLQSGVQQSYFQVEKQLRIQARNHFKGQILSLLHDRGRREDQSCLRGRDGGRQGAGQVISQTNKASLDIQQSNVNQSKKYYTFISMQRSIHIIRKYRQICCGVQIR